MERVSLNSIKDLQSAILKNDTTILFFSNKGELSNSVRESLEKIEKTYPCKSVSYIEIPDVGIVVREHLGIRTLPSVFLFNNGVLVNEYNPYREHSFQKIFEIIDLTVAISNGLGLEGIRSA